MIKLYKGDIQDDNLKITLMRLSYGCGYQRFRSYFYYTAMWYAKKKKHLTVRPDKYLLKYLIKLNPDVKIESIEDFVFNGVKNE